ncbi:hypothetical protein CEXT_627801 [Caerostris extrusa]|uniref:Uncharacterized protein n=1 Tax=Caerostris extrusa TaxID=172846 RepID=A0AAV4XCZ9_CAEEX|nr:hypothetical protein CEXT_627801 [Caerostris extrusa]
MISQTDGANLMRHAKLNRDLAENGSQRFSNKRDIILIWRRLTSTPRIAHYVWQPQLRQKFPNTACVWFFTKFPWQLTACGTGTNVSWKKKKNQRNDGEIMTDSNFDYFMPTLSDVDFIY